MTDRKYTDEELEALLGEPKRPPESDLDDINAVLTTIANDVRIITGCVLGLVIGIAVYLWKHNLL